MEQERKLSKMERQLARQGEVRAERALRRGQGLDQGVAGPDGIIVGAPRNMLQSLTADLVDGQTILQAGLDDIGLPIRHTDGTLHVALEFCPIYTKGTSLNASKLEKHVFEEEDLINSRVGMKWVATKRAIEELHALTQQMHTQLIVHATFADIGVMVETRAHQDSLALTTHETIYKKLMQHVCEDLEIPLIFRRISDIVPVSWQHTVERFITSSEGITLSEEPPLETLISLLGRSADEIPLSSQRLRDRASTLLHLFRLCQGNITLLKGMVDTYLNYPTTQGCDLHLGVERAGSNLTLQVLHRDSDTAKIPKLNIIVA